MKPKFFQIVCIFVAIWVFNGCYYPSGISKAEFRQLPRYLQHKYQGKHRKNAFSVDTFYCIMVNEGLAIPYRDSVVGHYFCKNELIVLDKFNGTEIWDTLDFNYREVLVDNDRISQRLIDSMYIDKKRRKKEMYRGKDSIVKYNSISMMKDMGFVFQQKSPPPRKLNHVIVAVRCKMIALIYRNFRIPKNFDYLEKGYSNLSGYYRGGFDNDCWKNLPQFGMHTPNMAFYFYADSFSMITQEQMAKLQWEKTPYKRIEIGY